MGWREWLGVAALFVAYQAPALVGKPWLLLLFFVVAWAIGRRYGLEGSGGRWRYLPLGFAMAMGAKGLALLVGSWAGVYRVEAGGGLALGALLVGVPYTFLPSIAEDILTRGYLFGQAWRPWVFVVVSSVVYVLNHVYRLDEWWMLFAFGCAYGAGVARAGTLWGAVGLHWGWNFANVFYGQVLPVEAISVVGGRAISAGAHLAMLVVVWRWWGVTRDRDRGWL